VGILISDMVMPGGMDGRTLCREASLSAPDVKTLLISGYASSPESAIGPPLLKKPFTSFELQRALDGLMA
jgi:CheY-like chemotaxis protein